MTIQNEIEEFVASHLPSDVAGWLKRYKTAKVIHDALWGTFRLEAHEVALLDTPLLQRLRFLHQTGAVYLTFPSAHHTRFEHTLGVAYQSERLCEALRRPPIRESTPESRFDDAAVRDIRFAALLHDTGHGPFSHTSEQFFSALPQINKFRSDNPDLRESGAGEILSYLIVNSCAFGSFVKRINSTFKITINCERIGRIITGTLPADQMYLGEVIHGPFDADKLDYMPRDGLFSGLRMHVDMDRLFCSIHVRTSTDHKVSRIAGMASGLSPLTQIMFNKMLLFMGMYHHHKVRAVDCMLWAVFELAHKRKAKIGGVELKSPVDFLKITDDQLLVPELCSDEDIQLIIRQIRNREIWKKALVIARNTVPQDMVDGTSESGDPRFNGITNLRGDEPEKAEVRREIARQIWSEANEPCKEHEVWLDVPKPPSMGEAKKMWITAPGISEPRRLADFMPIDQWVELYGTHQSRAHVFAPPAACTQIGEAAERVLKRRYGLEFLPEARGFAKSD